jgi:type I restriction enzyme, S subunit
MKTTYRTKKLGDVCEIKKGKKPNLYTSQTKTRLPYLGAKFMRGSKNAEYAEKADKNSIPVGRQDLIIICDGSKSGEVFSGFEGVLSSTMARIDPNHQEIDPKYLQNFLYVHYKLFNIGKKGAAIPHLDFNIFSNLAIPLPPLVEQKKIVAKLEKLLAKINEAKKLRAEAQEATQPLLSAELHKVFEEGKKQGWDEKTFEDVLVFKTGKLDSNAMVPGGKYPFFTCAQKTYEIDSHSFDQKAVLLAGNNAAGKYSVKFYDGKFDAYQRTYVISVKEETELDYTFLTNYISHILNDLRDLSVGANTKFLTMRILNRLQIPIPPFTEQKKIVDRLDSISEKVKQLQEHQKTTSNDLLALEQSILNKAFSGGLVK